MLNGTVWKFNDAIAWNDPEGTLLSINWVADYTIQNAPFLKNVSNGDVYRGIMGQGSVPRIDMYVIKVQSGTPFAINGLTLEFVAEPDMTEEGLEYFMAWLNLNAVQNPSQTYIVKGTQLRGIANAIRNKTGETGDLTFPDGFVNAVDELKSNADVESVLGSIRNVAPQNIWNPDTQSAQVRQGVTYTVSAFVTHDGKSHNTIFTGNLSGPGYIEMFTCTYYSYGSTPASGFVRRYHTSFTPGSDATLTLRPDSGLTMDRIMLEIGDQATEYQDSTNVFPSDYVKMVNDMVAIEATGVYF